MTEHVFKVVDESYDVYWVDDARDIKSMFGSVIEVTKYQLVDPVDITDSVNGDYLREDEYK